MPAKQKLDHLLSGLLVEIAGRFVGNENRRVRRERARQCDALLLAARQLRRIMRQPLRKPDAGKLRRRAFMGVADAGQFQRHRDIFQRGHGRDQMKGLKHDADIAAAKSRQRVFAQVGEVLAGDLDGAGIGAFEAGEHHQQGRLAGARGADQADRLAFADIEVDILEDMNACRALSERKIDPGQRNRRAVCKVLLLHRNLFLH